MQGTCVSHSDSFLVAHRDLGIAAGAVVVAVAICLVIDEIVTPVPGPEPLSVVAAFTAVFLVSVLGAGRFGGARAAAAAGLAGWITYRWIFLVPPGATYIPHLHAQLAFGIYSVSALAILCLIAEAHARKLRRTPPSLVAIQRSCGTILACDVTRGRFIEIRDI